MIVGQDVRVFQPDNSNIYAAMRDTDPPLRVCRS